MRDYSSVRNFRSTRQAAETMSPKERLEMGDRLRKMLDEQPSITIRELCVLTGAPPSLATFVRKRWKAQQTRGKP